MRRIFSAILIATLTAALGTASASAGLLDEHGAIAASVAAIKEKAGGDHLRALQVEIRPTELTIQLQDPHDRRHIDEWKFARIDLRLFNWDRVSGPLPVELNLINPDLEANLFDLDSVDFAGAAKLLDAAIGEAALEDDSQVTGIEIKRQVLILPHPSSGPVLWTIDVRSGRESAEIFANAGGHIVGRDLSGTARAKNLDILQNLDMAADAARDFKNAVGGEAVLRKITIGRSDIAFATNIAEDPRRTAISGMAEDKAFLWNLNGLRRPLTGNIRLNMHGIVPEDPPFAIDEVDWRAVPKLPSAAQHALQMPQGRVTEMTVSKSAMGVAAPVLQWKVDVADENGDKGYVLADTAGAIKDIQLPESRRKPSNWLEPATIVAGLARIDREFGAGARFAEITFLDERADITAADPRHPGQMASFSLRDRGFDRDPMAVFAMMHAQDRPFTIAELGPLTAQHLADLEARTVAAMHLANCQVTSVTIGRANMDPSPQGNVVVEIRALVPPFDAPIPPGGRVVYELDGRVVKQYLP